MSSEVAAAIDKVFGYIVPSAIGVGSYEAGIDAGAAQFSTTVLDHL